MIELRLTLPDDTAVYTRADNAKGQQIVDAVLRKCDRMFRNDSGVDVPVSGTNEEKAQFVIWWVQRRLVAEARRQIERENAADNPLDWTE